MRVLLTGATGVVGSTLWRNLARDHEVTPWGYTTAKDGMVATDLRNAEAVCAAFAAAHPDAVVHTAAVSGPDDAERDPENAWRLNADATLLLAKLCSASGARMIHFSTDLVFDGKRGPYAETDTPSPLNVYGRTKLAAEIDLLQIYPRAVALRISLAYGWGSGGRKTVLDDLREKLSKGIAVNAFRDQIRTPTPLFGVAAAVGELLKRPGVGGILHCAGGQRLSRLDLALIFCRMFGYPESLVRPCSMYDVTFPARRPEDSSLVCDRMAEVLGLRLPGVEESLVLLKREADAKGGA